MALGRDGYGNGDRNANEKRKIEHRSVIFYCGNNIISVTGTVCNEESHEQEFKQK